jgi:hypothetical protein
MSRTQVFGLLKCGVTSVKDAECSGHPSTSKIYRGQTELSCLCRHSTTSMGRCVETMTREVVCLR